MSVGISSIVHISIEDGTCGIQSLQNEVYDMQVDNYCNVVEIEIYSDDYQKVSCSESQVYDKLGQISNSVGTRVCFVTNNQSTNDCEVVDSFTNVVEVEVYRQHDLKVNCQESRFLGNPSQMSNLLDAQVCSVINCQSSNVLEQVNSYSNIVEIQVEFQNDATISNSVDTRVCYAVNSEFSNVSEQVDSCTNNIEVQVARQDGPNVSHWESQFIDKRIRISNSSVTRVCSAVNCQSTNVGGKLYPFPYIFRNIHGKKVVNKAGLERCREWIRLSGNMRLLNVNPGYMCNGYYMCANHFNHDQFNSKNNDTLKKLAIPTLFNCNPISNEAMSAYDSGWNIRQFNEDAFVEYMEKNIIDITEDEQLPIDINNEGLEVNNNNVTCVGSVVNINRPEIVKKCCVRGCSNIYEELYSFPNLFKKDGRVINLRAVQKEWLRKCGNPLLLNRNPSKLFEQVFVCKEHFSEDSFCRNKRSIVSAIPVHFQYDCLSNEVMHKFDMAWKVPHILSNKITEFDDDEEKNVASENDLTSISINELEEDSNRETPTVYYSKLQRCCYPSCNGSN
ncbi:THAP domain-containing protein 5 [Frankliniella fusca]|uniref:THAP domain-containing protein 5 n=1 Tax=Frankliniella fusca TaxID=407009 RepID=A0AAE1LD92_9NEOP|nr:THAP domain-containing protein 5 [Frankliniella fusca]